MAALELQGQELGLANAKLEVLATTVPVQLQVIQVIREELAALRA